MQERPAQDAENRDFRRYLCSHHRHVEQFKILACEAQARFDCTQCGNCCHGSIVPVGAEDLSRIAAFLGVSAAEVERLYTEVDPDPPHGRVLKSSRDACVFLHRELCLVYEARPETCRAFPHISANDHSLGSRMTSLCRWAERCPILADALERYKQVVGFHGSQGGRGAHI